MTTLKSTCEWNCSVDRMQDGKVEVFLRFFQKWPNLTPFVGVRWRAGAETRRCKYSLTHSCLSSDSTLVGRQSWPAREGVKDDGARRLSCVKTTQHCDKHRGKYRNRKTRTLKKKKNEIHFREIFQSSSKLLLLSQAILTDSKVAQVWSVVCYRLTQRQPCLGIWSVLTVWIEVYETAKEKPWSCTTSGKLKGLTAAAAVRSYFFNTASVHKMLIIPK